MPIALMLALQAAAAPPPPPPPPLLVLDFDLARLPAPALDVTGQACRREPDDTITVCGRRARGAYPLAEMARIFEPGRLIARTRVAGNLTGDVHVERGENAADRGAVPNRVMLGLRLPF